MEIEYSIDKNSLYHREYDNYGVAILSEDEEIDNSTMKLFTNVIYNILKSKKKKG